MSADLGPEHDSEAAAARFLGGALSARAHRTFERHLVGCEACWREVELGRSGRRLVESARELAPPELRERLRAVVASESAEPAAMVDRRGRLSRWLRRGAQAHPWVLAGAVALVVAVPFGVWQVGQSPAAVGQPVAISQAVSGFREHRLPGTRLPQSQAPDLAVLGLTPVGAAAGSVAGTEVTAFSYRDTAGRDVMVYLSAQPFPTAVGAWRLAGDDRPEGPWVATTRGVTVLCGRSPHALLVLSLDRQLVLDTAGVLRVT